MLGAAQARQRRKMQKAAMALCVLPLTVAPVRAATPSTVREMLALCTDDIRECRNYIGAQLTVIEMQPNNDGVCTPDSLNDEAKAVVAWLLTHPETRDTVIAAGISQAIHAIYTCKTPQP